MDTENRGDGWVLFAGVMIMVAGFLNFIYGIAAIDNSSAFVGGSHYVLFDNLNTWGWIGLLMSHRAAVRRRSRSGAAKQPDFGRVIGIASASISAILILLYANAFPFVAFGIFIIDLLVIYGLVAYGGRPSPQGGPVHEQRDPRHPRRARRHLRRPGGRPRRGARAPRSTAGGDRARARTFGLVKIATLIALDAPPASYAWQVANAIDGGATAEDILGVLRAVAPQVGGPRVIAAAPEIMLALGLSLPEMPE